MAAPDTDLSVANRASANEAAADSIAQDATEQGVGNADASSVPTASESAIKLFDIKTRDEYDALIRSLSRGAGVAAWVNGAWDRNRIYRQGQNIDTKLIEALNRREGIYSPQQMLQIQQMKSSRVYPLMIDKICRRAEAIVADAFASVDRPEKLQVSPDVELTKEDRREIVRQLQRDLSDAFRQPGTVITQDQVVEKVLAMEEAAKRKIVARSKVAAGKMEDMVYRQLQAGGWYEAFDEMVKNATTLKLGCIYGPFATRDNSVRFAEVRGRRTFVAKPIFRYRWENRSPFDIFPAPGARSFDEGDLVDRVRFQPEKLLAQMDSPGWRKDAVESVVRRYHEQGFAYYTGFDSARGYAEETGNLVQRTYGFIECLRFYGHIQGRRIMDTGISGDNRKVDANALYHVCAVVCGSDVLFLSVLNPEIDFRPYLGCSFAPNVGGLWGKGFGELAASEDSMQAAYARAEVNNAGFVTTPTRTIYPGLMVNPQLGAAYPGQTYVAKYIPGVSQKPVDYHTVPNSLETLSKRRAEAEKYAHEMVGVPTSDMGSDRAAGAGRTATGFAQILKNASLGVGDFMHRLEKYVWRPNMARMVLLNNLHHDDDSVKCEADVYPQGVFSELDRQANASRKLEVLNALRGDPVFTTRRRAALVESIGQDADLPVDAIPTDADAAQAEQAEQAAQAAAAQAAAGGQGGTPQVPDMAAAGAAGGAA